MFSRIYVMMLLFGIWRLLSLVSLDDCTGCVAQMYLFCCSLGRIAQSQLFQVIQINVPIPIKRSSHLMLHVHQR
ncbi:hypothetical protein BD769DRAFT_71040 [Suillus cothurnatus]|nr:hypothetical protein BD769DRAFT_71040 [Suillus cothurnatus]